jgi:hypothetical protein
MYTIVHVNHVVWSVITGIQQCPRPTEFSKYGLTR